MAITKRKDNTSVGENVKKLEASYYWWKCKMVQPGWERIWQFLKKVAIYNLAIQLLVIYPREMKTMPTQCLVWNIIISIMHNSQNWK